jgi:hypothetical protein
MIKGKVRFGSTLIENAKVRIINQTTNTYIGDTLTDVNGEYEFEDVIDDNPYHLTVEHENGGTKYNAKSLWDVLPDIEDEE